MERHSQAFGGGWSRLQAFGSLDRGPLVAWIVVCKPLVPHVDRRSQAFGGSWSPLQAFGGIRWSSCTSLLVAYVDRRVEAFGGIRGSPFTSL